MLIDIVLNLPTDMHTAKQFTRRLSALSHALLCALSQSNDDAVVPVVLVHLRDVGLLFVLDGRLLDQLPAHLRELFAHRLRIDRQRMVHYPSQFSSERMADHHHLDVFLLLGQLIFAPRPSHRPFLHGLLALHGALVRVCVRVCHLQCPRPAAVHPAADAAGDARTPTGALSPRALSAQTLDVSG